jgi:hypothetical protein
VSATEKGAGLPIGPSARGHSRRSGRGARVREEVSRDLGRAIEIGRGRSKPGGVNGYDGATPSRGGEVAGVGVGAS